MASPSLRRRLVAGLLAGLLLAWAGVVALAWRDTHREVDAVLDAHLFQTAALIARQAGHELVELGDDDVGDEALPYGQAVAFQVWDEAGTLALRSASAPAVPLAALREGITDATVQGAHWRVVAVSDRASGLRVLVGEDLAARERLERRFVLRTSLPFLAGFLALGVLAWWVVGRSLAPLQALRAELARRDARELAPLATTGIPEEILPLAEQANALFARIRRSFESERRFTAQAAHELRTPVAAVRAHAEVALAAADAGERQDALRSVVADCDRLARLVEQLLALGRLEELPADARPRCRLAAVAAEVLADLAPRAIGQGVELELEGDEAIEIEGDPASLGILLRNLVDNALRHGAATRVRVEVGRVEGRPSLVVADSGRGVAEEQLPDLGRPFHRGDAPVGEGTGLGLSIVARIAGAHGAAIHYGKSGLLGGLEARVSFPVPA